MSEVQVLTKVEELMRALDQVKRYRALTRLLVEWILECMGKLRFPEF